MKRLYIIILCVVLYTLQCHSQQITTDTVSFRVGFEVSTSAIDPDFGDNGAVLQSLNSFLNMMKSDTTRNVSSLYVFGSCSPEGPLALNQRLVRERAKSLSDYITHQLSPESNVSYGYQIPTNIKSAMNMLQAEGKKPTDQKTIYSELRFSQADFVVDLRQWPELVTETPAPEVITELPTDTIESVVEEPVMEEEIPMPTPQPEKFIFLKTNAVGWGLAISNIAIEYQWNKHWSFALPAYYSAVNYFKRTRKFRTTTLQPELRYWFNGPNGWYIGVHGGIGWFNYALDGDYRYQDHDGARPALGGGISTGFRFNLSKSGRWRMECTVGGGVYRACYDKFLNVPNGEKVADKLYKTWYGVDNAAVSVVYTFDLKGGKR